MTIDVRLNPHDDCRSSAPSGASSLTRCSEESATTARLRERVRHASMTLLRTQANADEISVVEMDAAFRPGRILATHMAFILIAGEALRITFKVHFNARAAKELAFRIFGRASADEISESQAIDFFKEYANLVGGNLVATAGDIGIDLGISLPLSTRGFYEVFADYTEKQAPVTTFCDFWQLSVDGKTVVCSAQFELLEISMLEALASCVIAEDSEGEMDFL